MPPPGGFGVTPKKKRKVKPTRVSSPDSVDRNREARQQQATRKVVRKMRTKPVPSGDQVDRNRAARAQQLAKSVPKTPDQADRKRSPAQQKHDAAVVKKNVREARGKAVEKQKSVDGPGPVKLRPEYAKARAAQKKQAVARLAPVLKVLEQTTRPVHAVAGATDAAVTGKNVPKAALRGIKNQDRTTFSDVLKHAGVKNKTVRGVGGFVLDVGLDPTTYVTGGTGSVASKAGSKAAARVEKKAVKAGLDSEQAARAADRARKQAEKGADQAKGVTVKVAGHEVPGVRKATAVASKPARAAGRRVVPERVRAGARAAAADVNPNVAPAGVAKDASDQAIRATRTARAKSTRGLHEAQQQALGIKKQIGEENYSRIIDAIENGTISKLPDDLARVAVRVRSQFRHANRQRKHAGIRGGEIKARPQVRVPEVTADTSASGKALGKARRAEARAQRDLEGARSTADVHQGRAEVLSRNVSGSRAEKAAERGRAKRKSRLAPKYAGGGHGVQQTATAAKDAAQRFKNATAAREAAESAHAKNVTDAATQRSARHAAEKVNAKREAAPKEYIPHHLTDEALAEGEKRAGGVGRKVIRPSSSKARSDNRPLSVLREEFPGKYSEDLPTLYANRKAEGATAVARAELNRRIAALGRDVKKGRDVVLEKGESVYHIVGSDISKVDSKEVGRVIDEGGKKGRYVVLHDDIVKRAIEGATPTLEGPGIVRGYDKVQAGFKRVALATPGFHLRNLVGDTQNAYLGQAGHRLPRNMAQAGRVLKAEGRRDKALRKLEPGKQRSGTLKTKRYGNVSFDEVAEQLSKHGAMRSGYTARELPELTGEKATVRRVRAPRRLKQALINREDLPRVTTALEALKRGATWEEAAQKVADIHFDYGHLTRFERNVGRRVAPFYTFTARNIPLQTKSLITKPGKFANYEKLREEAAKAVGMDEESQKTRKLTDQLKKAGVKFPKEWEANLSEWEQRNVGVPVRWKGHTFTVSMGLPLIDLNEFPGAALDNQMREYFEKGMSLTSPLLKNPTEYLSNHSFFFRDDIERDGSRLVAAPGWVTMLPKDLQKRMGVTRIIDKKTGKSTLAYRAKSDYIVKSMPGTPAFLNKLATEGHDRVGKGTGGKVLAFAGVKATPFDPVQSAVNLAYARVEEIDGELGDLRQQPNPANGRRIGAKNPTPRYVKLLVQRRLAESVAFQGRWQQGYKELPATGGPPKNRGSNGRVRVPGVSGRVSVPGVSGGRVQIP